jgi:hypothetical protein
MTMTVLVRPAGLAALTPRAQVAVDDAGMNVRRPVGAFASPG